jgi:hypothetical protein
MLKHVAHLRREGRIRLPRGEGVLVKAIKPGQDQRFDLPSIGPATIEAAAEAGLAGIAVLAGQTVIAEPELVCEKANKAGLFVVGIAIANPGVEP